MENWEKKYTEKREREIEELMKEKSNLFEELNTELDKPRIYSIYWRLKEIFEELKHKYMIIQRWSRIDHSPKINNALCREIYYFEKCFSMLKEKHGAERVDLQHYLNAASLEYEYFIDLGFELPQEFLTEEFELGGLTKNPTFNLIINNVQNAQKNLNLILEYKEKEENHNELFLYFEVMGDLYIHIYLILKKSRISSPDRLRSFLFNAYSHYVRSYDNKLIVERGNPQTYFDGLHGWPCLRIFIDFFKEIGENNVHNVRLKKEFLESKFLTNNEIKKILNNIKGD